MGNDIEYLEKKYDFEILDNKEDMLEWFLNTTHDLQKVICNEADKIKIDLFEEASLKMPDLTKNAFVNTVASRSAIELKIEKMKDPANSIDNIINSAKGHLNHSSLLNEICSMKK